MRLVFASWGMRFWGGWVILWFFYRDTGLPWFVIGDSFHACILMFGLFCYSWLFDCSVVCKVNLV